MKRPLLEIILDTSARVGGLLVPAGSLESHLGKFANQLTVWTHDEIYKVNIIGSAIGLVCSGKSLLVCSMHQLRGVKLSDVGLLLPDGSNLITSSGSRTFQEGEHTHISDAYDVAAFDFSEPTKEHPQLKRSFFNFDRVPPDTPNTHILAFVVAGYPTSDQKYELEDKNHLGMLRRVLVAEAEGETADPALLRLKYVRPLDFDPDGLSGGPAFVVQIVDGKPTVFLGGMVVRSGRSACYILKSGYLWQFLHAFL